jgi:predicted O-methyltransferase YrrM
MDKHEFLRLMHNLIRPEIYLEIGVQYGQSLRLAKFSRVAIGIDPNPQVTEAPSNMRLYEMHSSEFYDRELWTENEPAGLAFIDGSHLFEDAVDDFDLVLNSTDRDSVAVFDDVLPRNEVEASRTPNLNVWAGDVWRLHPYLTARHPRTTFVLVDVEPTGVMVAYDLNWSHDRHIYEYANDPVPESVLTRKHAVSGMTALTMVSEWIDAKW